MKEIDRDALAAATGKGGNPAYIGHEARVIDVSESPLWKGGLHMGRHQAGHDLTADITAAPHGLEVLDRYPQVGTLKQEAPLPARPDRPIPPALASLLTRYPFLRRHPHPMTVHFPIVFMLATTVFSLLYLVTCFQPFETTAFHCLGAGLLMTPVAMMTGLYTWWLNYMAHPMRPVTIKRNLSITLFGVQIIAFIWRFMDPTVLDHLAGLGLLYLILILAVTPMVLIVGMFGGMLTFPLEK
jgi:predicted heme/steroid binding protein/uncharacterized membrane protein